MYKPTVLVADADTHFLNSIAQYQQNQIDIVVTADQKSSQMAIADLHNRFSAICLNANICDPAALPLIRFCKAYRPATPLYLLNDTNKEQFDLAKLEALHINMSISKPVSPNQLLQFLIPGGFFDPSEALLLAKDDPAKSGDTKDVDENKMHAIKAHSFISGSKSFFDLYIKLSSNRFVMLLKAGDPLDQDRLMSYLKKGVEYFYIKSEAQQHYLQYCDKLTETLINTAKIPQSVKETQLKNLGQETFQYLRSGGISEASMQSAQRFVVQANNLAKSQKLDSQTFVVDYLNNLLLADHGTACVMVISLMTKEMDITDAKVTNLIALSAFLHDVGLISVSDKPHVLDEDEELMSVEEKIIFETHPKVGADLLRKMPHINPLLPQVVLQHHERRTKKGFPLKIGSGSISPISEMIGLADTFLHLVKKLPKGTDVIQFIRERHMDDFSIKTLEGLFKAFAKK